MDELPALPREQRKETGAIKQKNSSRGILSILVIGSVIAVVAAVAGYLPRLHRAQALEKQTADLSIPTVSTVQPQSRSTVKTLELPAEVRPFQEASIFARTSGYLKRWLVDLGAQVREGQLLAEIDAPEVNQELAQAQAQKLQADAALALAKTTADRWSALIKTASVSEQEAAEKQADLALKTANVAAAEANVRRWTELQSFERVTAPFAGTITSRTVDVGDLVSATNGKELFRLAQTQLLNVYVHVPQSVARSITIGQPVMVSITEIPGKAFEAKVIRTAGAMDPQSRTLLTELSLENPKGEILAGSFAQVTFSDVATQPVLIVPANVLIFRSEGILIGTVNNQDVVELKKIEAGRDFGTSMEVVAGLGANDRMIINPPDALFAGEKVRLAGNEAPEK